MNYKEEQDMREMYIHYNYRCFVCGKQATNRAHILGQGKLKRHLYSHKVIDNIANWLPSCDRHNDLIDMSNNQLGAGRVALIIESDMSLTDKRESIEAIVLDNIIRKEMKV